MRPRNNIYARLSAAWVLCFAAAPGLYAQTAAPVTPVVVSPPPTPPVATPPEGEAKPEETGMKSLFLSPEDHINISNALIDYQNFLNAKTTEAMTPQPGVIEPPKEQEKYYTYPQFFMELLEYHTPEDWLVRVNGRKISPQMSPDQSELAIIAIDNERALFRWKPANMARVLDRWNKLPASKEQSDADNAPLRMDFNSALPNKVPNIPVMVDKDRKLVTFSLHSNQTFSSYVMRVLEGKVMPVTVENVPTAPPIISPVVPPVASPAALKPAGATTDDSDSGLNGLMKTIDKQDKQQGTKP